MNLPIKKLDPHATFPTKGHEGDAGIDLYTLDGIIFLAGEQKRVHTGIAMEIPKGYVGLVWDKSSVSFNQGLKVMGGVIDSGYRGEIIVSLINLSKDTQFIQKGQKCAQIIIQKYEDCSLSEVDELSDTVRGEGREGSTGAF